jgi:TP901 family phage tail tape measure protein
MDDSSIVKIMQSLDLNYNPAINSTINFEKRISSLNNQLAQLKLTAMNSAKDVSNSFSSQFSNMTGTKTILDQYGQPLKTIQTELNNMSKTSAKMSGSVASGYKTATTAAKQHGQAVKDVANEYNNFASEWQRRSSWFLSGALFYGGIKAAKEAVKTISDVEMGMVEIARVMEDSTFVFSDYRNELLQLGVDYGQSFETVQDIALRWAQAGYNVSDSLENTKLSLLALNTAELDAANATESMIGIMSQWQLSSSDLSLLLDKINKTADDFTITSQDLVDGLLRSSGAAKIMNLSIDETIALLTVMREASGRTGQEVGNALNSILSYIQRPSSIKTLGNMGINMFSDSAKTQFRNVMEIFQDIASKWDTTSDSIKDGFIKSADEAGLFNEELATALGMQEEWNDLQTRDISQASAGVYRRNYFIGMIERLSEAQKVLNGITDAAGYSQTENANTMDTLEKKYQSLQTAAQQLAVALGDAGLLDVLKSLTDKATDVSQGIAEMDSESRALLMTCLELLAAAKAIKAVGGLFGVNATLGAAMSSMPAWLGTATAVAPGWTKLIPLLIAAAAAVGLYAYNAKSASDITNGLSEKQDKLTESYNAQLQAAEEKSESLLAEAKEAETLAKKLENLSNQENLNVSQKAQMKAIVDQLNTSFPNLSLSIDENTGKVIGNTGAIYDNIEALKQQAIAQAYQSKMEATASAYVDQELLTGQTQNQLDIARAKYAELQLKKNQITQEVYQVGVNSTNGNYSDDWLRIKGELNDVYKKYGFDSNKSFESQFNNTKKEIESLTDLAAKQNLSLFELDNELSGWADKATSVSSEISSGNNYVPSVGTSKNSGSSSTTTYKNSALDEALKVLEYKKHMNEISTEDEIEYLNKLKLMHVNTADELMDINERIYDAKQEQMDETLENSKNWITEETKYGKLSCEELIAAYERVRDNQIDNIDAVKYATEGLFDTYKDMLSEEQDLIRDAYDERIQLIEDEAEAEKEKLEEKKKALQEELDELDKADSERSHSQTMADLYDQLAYYQVRTSEEARKKVAEIEAEIDEEKYKYELEQQKETINDKMDAIDDEIDEIDKAAEIEKKKWERSYKLTEEAFDSHGINMVALAGTMSKSAYQQWVDNYLTPLKTALSTGDFKSFDFASGDLPGSMEGLYADSKSNYVLANMDGTSSAKVGDIVVTGGGLYRKNADGTSTRVGELSGGNTSDYSKVIEEYNKLLPTMHEGGETLSYGAVYMKPGELVFDPNLSLQLKGLLNFLKGNNYQSNSTVSQNDNRKEVKINTLLKIEKNYMEDEVDSDMLARELRRQVSNL